MVIPDLFMHILHEYCKMRQENAGGSIVSCIYVYNASPKMDFVA